MEKRSREEEVKAQLKALNFDPIGMLVEATNAAKELLSDPEIGIAAIGLVQKGSKMLLDELKEARKLEAEKKSPTYLMIPSGFDADGNAVFENKLLNG
jgi:hypothetical protein